MLVKKVFCICFLLIAFLSHSQEITQTVTGRILDHDSKQPLTNASIVIIGSDPLIGAISNFEGNFIIEDVPVGRYDLKIDFVGYETVIKPEVVVTSSKKVILNISLVENINSLEETIISPRSTKNMPINRMATVSARKLSIEEANRYAGGFDDPARLAASFPGVSSSIGSNAIVIRGNAPKFLQWKIEDVEIPNPNHFANLGVFGGGGLTALSSNLLASSDFFTGAFPAEYNNALSGVFDIRMREGNDSEYEHTFEVGTLGIDLASEGPIGKKGKASYLINYRYSTLGLISSLLPEESQGINYQDLSFKIKIPTKNAGVFSLWGIGLIDRSGSTPKEDTESRNYYTDIEKQDVKQFMGALGVNHRLVFNNSAYLNSTITASTNGIDLKTNRLNSLSILLPQNKIDNENTNVTFKTFYNEKFSSKHTNRTGITIRGMHYSLNLKEANGLTSDLKNLVSERGYSTLFSTYSNSSFSFKKVKLNIGINTQFFTLNEQITIEPRVGVSYKMDNTHKVSFGYGLHSRIEALNIYLANTINSQFPRANQKLDFSKAHHFVFAYDWNLSSKTHLKIEPYFQYLFSIPIIRNSTSSLLNLQNDWFVNETYVNLGKGQNYGVDLTLEQYINKGFYYLISASLFNSKYKTDTDVWYDTRFNKNFLLNFLVGKEFKIGRKNQSLLGLNVRVNVQGGDRYSKIDTTNSILEKEVVYDKSTPFTEQTKSSLITHFTINYEWYRSKTTQKLSLKILNASGYREFMGHRYNISANSVDEHKEALIIPNLSYKISF